MRKRIYLNMCALASVILIIVTFCVMVMLYNANKITMKEQMESEVRDIAVAMEHMKTEQIYPYFREIADENNSRITFIAKDGTVLFDSSKDVSDMKNHGKRPEIQEARKSGSAFDIRYSDTMKEKTYYFSVQLDSGDFIRLSYLSQSLFMQVLGFAPYYIIIFILIVCISSVVSWKMSKYIIEPINNIDLHNPEVNFRYKEFNPLLKRISKYNQERTKNEKLRREFTANVSHELKTPITSISGYADLLRNGMVKQEDTQMFAEKIYNESARLVNLVNDIIKLSRLDEKKVGIDKELVNLEERARKVKELLEPVEEKYNVILELDTERVVLSAVELMIEELLYNLCENAMKYNKPGGYVRLSIHPSGENALIEVVDNGIGIPKDCQSRIFERFYRVDKSHSKQIGGTGLGLAIVKHVVEYHEGNISIESEINKGTRILVTLPGLK